MPCKDSAHSEILRARNECWPPGARGYDTLAAFQEWVSGLKSARVRFIREQPLRAGEHFALKVVRLVVPSNPQHRRPIPACAQVAAATITITLLEPLAGTSVSGDSPVSRVWLASTATGDRVVAKFYFPSLFIPEEQYNRQDNDFILPRQCALTEEVAYNILQSAQGAWLPYYLGRNEVNLSHGEMADVALFEYINGRSLLDHKHAQPGGITHKKSDDPESHFQVVHRQHQKWFKRLREITHEMHDAGVTHCDLYGRNILVPESNLNDLVFVDFETARDDMEGGGNDLRNAVLGFTCCDDHVDELYSWCGKNKLDVLEWYLNFPTITSDLYWFAGSARNR
ncbi:unnamed protein product [Peniophora sp. CBMAI 1063]|nr:unnamed protein product [Peniophora sp. CBMAI 1063]